MSMPALLSRSRIPVPSAMVKVMMGEVVPAGVTHSKPRRGISSRSRSSKGCRCSSILSVPISRSYGIAAPSAALADPATLPVSKSALAVSPRSQVNGVSAGGS